MRGHWLSGTRKLNRHYQSGTPGKGMITFSGMTVPISGFKTGGIDNQYPLSNTNMKFYSSDEDNIIAAPVYKIWEVQPTQYTLESDVRMLYAPWTVSRVDGSMYVPQSTTQVWDATVPVWRFGLIKWEPYWSYVGTVKRMYWGIETETNADLNQNGIDKNTLPSGISGAFYNGATYDFENAYSGKSIKVIQPVWELIAIPEDGRAGITSIVQTDQGRNYRFDNQLKVKGITSSHMRVGYDYDTLHIDDTGTKDGKRYTAFNGIFSKDTEIGVIGSPYGSPSDKVYSKITDKNGNIISAGYYSNEGITYNMVYAIRLDHLEVVEVEPSLSVLPFDVDADTV